MTRVLSLTLTAALAAALFLLPGPPAERLAAMQCGALLAEPAQGGDGERTLARTLLAGPAADPAIDGRIVVRIGTARLLVAGREIADPGIGEETRRSLLRSLRAIGAADGFEPQVRPAGPGEVAADFVVRAAEGKLEVELSGGGSPLGRATTDWHPPSRGSLFPPLVAIVLAIVLRRPVIALASGVLLGAVLVKLQGGAGLAGALAGGTWAVFGKYFYAQLIDSFRYQIVLFVVFMLAMVGVITRAGGIRGMMNSIARLASSVRGTQTATFLMGLSVFFDDYANTILVGSTMRPLTDRFRIAREKLAYIVDSTAAPVAGISVFSTWIAFEVSTFAAQLPEAGLSPADGYNVFFETLPYRFYCLFTLALVGLVVWTGRDFGPMLTAERRARGGKLLRDGARPMVGEAATHLQPSPRMRPTARVALIPLFTFIAVTLLEILRGGGGFSMGARLFSLEGMAEVLFNGSGSWPLMAGAAAGLVVACGLAVLGGLRGEIPAAAWSTVRSMGVAIVILYLAWMIGAVCGDLGTAPYLSVLLSERLPPLALPLMLFVLSGVIAFSTGSSWSTMTILLPLVVGLAFQLGETAAIGGHLLMVVSIGAVLEGSIFGDHCSPISDTTVMSSIASASDHIDHVRTQIPYALTTMSVALFVGYLPAAAFGLESRPWLPFASLALGFALLTGVLYVAGHKVESGPGEAVARTDAA